jgi:hypothetical protein
MSNKKNLMYFEGSSMRDLHKQMENWQTEHKKRFMSVNIEREGDHWCCIALSNPTEMVLTDASGDPIIMYDSNDHPMLYTCKQ